MEKSKVYYSDLRASGDESSKKTAETDQGGRDWKY